MFGSILGAVGGVVGSLLGARNDKKAAQQAQSVADRQRAEDIALQKEFAQNSVQWRVEDAKKAGLHPLAALGVSGSSYTPVGGNIFAEQSPGDYGIGDALSGLGQDIDRAREAGMTKAQRLKAEEFADKRGVLQLRHAELQNQILEMEIASRLKRLSQSDQAAPALPLSTGPDGSIIVDGQADSFDPSVAASAPAVVQSMTELPEHLIEIQAAKPVANIPRKPTQEAGSNPDMSWTRIPWRGLTAYAPSRMVNGQDRYEEDWLGAINWNIRNRLKPMIPSPSMYQQAPPLSWLPPGYDYWDWNIPNMAWVPAKAQRGYFRRFRHAFSNAWGF